MLVQIDAAQLEWRGAVWLSNDKVGIQELNEKQDAHSLNQKAFNLPDRTTAKIYLFRTIFRGSGWSFAHDPAFSHVSNDPAFWDDVNEKFYKKYAGLNEWHHSLARTVAARLPIVSPLGREWLVPMRDNGEIPWTVLSNYPVQGTCADLMTINRVAMFRRIQSRLHLNDLVKLVSTVHDSIVLDCHVSTVPEVVQLAHDVFNDLPRNLKKLWNLDVPIAFPCEAKVGVNMKDMKVYAV